MNTRDLQYFAMLVKLKNYTQVAKYFNVSQPSITQAIRRLEQEFDTKLVRKDRVHRDEMITRSGQLLIPQKYLLDQLVQLSPTLQYRSFPLVIHLAIHEIPQKRFLFVGEAA